MITPGDDNRPSDDHELFEALESSMPTIMIDRDLVEWLVIDMTDVCNALVEGLLDHRVALEQLSGPVDTSDSSQYRAYVQRLEEMIEPDEARIDVNEGDLLQFTGVKYFVHNGKGYFIEPGMIVRGHYCGVGLYPFMGSEGDTFFEKLPVGVNFAVTDFSLVSEDGDIEVEFELKDGEHILLTLHDPDIHVSKLERIAADENSS